MNTLCAGTLDRKLPGLAGAFTFTSHLDLVAAQCALVDNLDRVAAKIQCRRERNLIARDFAFLERYLPLRPGHGAGELLPVGLEVKRCGSRFATASRHVPGPFSRDVGSHCQ